MTERIEVGVSYDLTRGYYITTSSNVPLTAALSLAGLRKQIEAALMPDVVDVRLVLDRIARLERDARRRGGAPLARDRAGHRMS